MPSKKQRRRREKTFRHEYGFVTYDEDGNEVEVDSAAIRPERKEPSKAKATAAKKGKGSSRTLRPAEPPTWNRALRRGGFWGAGMLVVSLLFFKTVPVPERVILGLLYGVAFIPLTYWIDRTTYRSYLKRSGKTPPS